MGGGFLYCSGGDPDIPACREHASHWHCQGRNLINVVNVPSQSDELATVYISSMYMRSSNEGKGHIYADLTRSFGSDQHGTHYRAIFSTYLHVEYILSAKL